MARRKAINRTGINRRSDVSANAVWICYSCVKCKAFNFVHLGNKLLAPLYAYDNCQWVCGRCGFVHSKNTDLPQEWNTYWEESLLSHTSEACQRFWKGFFAIATENPQAYWKQCNVCGRILPWSAFSKHVRFGLLEKQNECRACKSAINAVTNPKRTTEQLREGTMRRRIGDLFAVLDDENKLDVEDLFKRFDSKCFKTGKPLDINKRSTWHIDHILPSKYFYPLTKENAALLSSEANENKRDRWPSEFYTPQELVRLSVITGANLELLSSKTPIYNDNIDVNAAVDKWLVVRNSTNLSKRIRELRKILEDNDLIDKLSDENKKRLGFA